MITQESKMMALTGKKLMANGFTGVKFGAGVRMLDL
ncbi:hypothetical protein F940_00013 [Acinetobacter radioresistens NIPH 2130]|nr:hypothetical protein F940_00013 [Acinetobacter radioresistens NIPH 2130]